MRIMGPEQSFAIHESHREGWLWLALTGELDLRSTSQLEDRLARLRVMKTPVRLDLSELDFIDSTALHLLVRTVGDARIKRWQFIIEPDVSPQVMGRFKLVQLEHFLLRGDNTRR